MPEKEQKNFTLPTTLLDIWDKFLPEGSQENSRNAAGALFLYMLMPSHIREVACNAAYAQNQVAAQLAFWNDVDEYMADIEKAEALVAAAKAVEAKQCKTLDDSPAEVG